MLHPILRDGLDCRAIGCIWWWITCLSPHVVVLMLVMLLLLFFQSSYILQPLTPWTQGLSWQGFFKMQKRPASLRRRITHGEWQNYGETINDPPTNYVG